MGSFLNQPYKPVKTTRDRVISSLVFGLFIFLFLFIFQPFGFSTIENTLTKLMVSAGFGLITVFMLFVFNFLLDPIITGPSWKLWKDILWDLVIATSIGVANYFYVTLIFSHPFVFRYLLISVWSAWLIAIIPVTIGYILTFNKIYRNALTGISGSDELFVPDEEIIFRAGNQKKEFRLNPKNILYLCSNDNYVTIFMLNGTSVSRNTIRGTLKSAESELNRYKCFLRCHKCYIVNIDYVAGMRGNYQNMTIRLKHADTVIPVSRSRASTVSKVLKKI